MCLLFNKSRKGFLKIQYPFTDVKLYKLGIEGNFINLMKSLYGKPTVHIVLYYEIMNTFSQDQEQARMSALTTDIQCCTGY